MTEGTDGAMGLYLDREKPADFYIVGSVLMAMVLEGS